MAAGDATFCLPSRGFWIWWRGAWRRYRCARRFGHFPACDTLGGRVCARCGTPLL